MFKVQPDQLDPIIWNEYKSAWEAASSAAQNQDPNFMALVGMFIQSGLKMAQKYHDHGLPDDEQIMWSHAKTHRDMLLEMAGYEKQKEDKEDEPEEVDLDMSDEEAMYNATHRWED